MRKVKYTSETFVEKFTAILEGFPRMDDIHPFRMCSSCVLTGLTSSASVHAGHIPI